MTPPPGTPKSDDTAPIRQLADEYFDFRQRTDLHRLLYLGRLDHLDHLERWEDVTPGAVANRQATLRDFASLAEQHAPDVGDDPLLAALADTVAFTARSSADQLEWRTEQTKVNPAFGIHATLLTLSVGST